ncbi:MAG TPA: GAF domain-containing protein [Anaerolineales bacterium]|nr:GAF domain-containing protein [Anaerolineales bacterium]
MASADTQTIRHLRQENIRLKSENNSLRDYVERLQRAMSALVDLQEKVDTISPQTDIFLLIFEVLTASLVAVGSENGSLLLLDDETGELVFVEVIGESRDKLLNYRLPKGTGVAGKTVASKRPMLVPNTRAEPSFNAKVDKYTGLESTSIVCVPLLDGERRLGAIEAVNTKSGRPFNQSDLEVMQLVGKLASLAIVEAERMS